MHAASSAMRSSVGLVPTHIPPATCSSSSLSTSCISSKAKSSALSVKPFSAARRIASSAFFAFTAAVNFSANSLSFSANSVRRVSSSLFEILISPFQKIYISEIASLGLG